jgi:hypothetical protein
MFPFALPTASVPNFKSCFPTSGVLPLAEGKGNGGKVIEVIADGVKSTNLHRWTANVAESPISQFLRCTCTSLLIGKLFFVLRTCLSWAAPTDFDSLSPGHIGFYRLAIAPRSQQSEMSFLGGGSKAGGTVNPDRMEMAVQECVIFLLCMV